jgi:hypothetical protein
MRTRYAVLATAVTWAGALPAQSRVVPLPDTLGANFSIADSARRQGTPEDYDAVLGVWHFTFQFRQSDGTFAAPFTGHWTFRKRPGERAVIEDQWRLDDPARPFESGTLTYRAYNPTRRLWEVQGTSTNNDHQWLPGVGWSDGTSRYLVQYYGKGTIIRFRYLAIEANRFLWRADMSPDGGTTWTRDWWTMEVTRVGK